MIQFMNDVIKISKDKITDKFVKDHLGAVVILLGHHKVSCLTLEYSQKGGEEGYIKILQVLQRWYERDYGFNC